MKADFQKLSVTSQQQSFNDFWIRVNAFGFHWHYHPEIEICYVKQGRGKRIVGESIENFTDGDLVLIGSNTPHSWITDEQFNASEKQIEVYVIQFSKEIFDALATLPEFKAIGQLLDTAKRGIKFDLKQDEVLKHLLQNVDDEIGFAKFQALMRLLQSFCDATSKEILSSSGYTVGFQKHQEERIMKVCNFIHDHFRESLTIKQLAELIAMNEASFCRFFKRTLGKTVIEYITELRIAHVCNEMQQTREPVYKIAYDTGFSSIAHFNKQFKKTMGTTPSDYRAVLR